MKFKTALEKLNAIASQLGSRLDTADLVIMVNKPGAVGGTPSVQVLDINAGFDWDANKILIATKEDLSVLTTEEREAILESVRQGSSWHAYQAQKKLIDKIAALELELAQLKNPAIATQSNVN